MMSRRLNKLPPIEKDDCHNHGQQQEDSQEAHFSGSNTARAKMPVIGQTSGAKKAGNRVELPPLLLPNLGLKTTPETAQADGKQGEEEPAALPRVEERERPHGSSLIQGRRPSKALLPLYPELSDECFRPFWDSKKPLNGRPVQEILQTMDEKEVLNTILDHLRPSLHVSADPKLPRRKMDGFPSLHQKAAIRKSSSHLLSQEKISLYKYYGVKLRNSRQKDLVKEQLKRLLGFSFREETDREGISESIGVAAFCHLPEILIALRDTGHFVPPKKPPLKEATFQDQCSERQIHTAMMLCYSKATTGAQPEDMIPFLEHIVSQVLFHSSTRNKDEDLTKAFLRSLIQIAKALLQSNRQDIDLPWKAELAIKINDVLENETGSPESIGTLHQAIVAITCMTCLKPALNNELMSQLVETTTRKVFCLPARTITRINAGIPTQTAYTQDLYHQTVTACSAMLTSFLSEAPNLDCLQEILRHTNIWIASLQSHERERAIKSTRHLLKFASEQADFDTTADFYLLGQLVAVLGLHIGNSVKEIGQTSAEAAYHLHCIILNKMGNEMEKKPKNKKGNTVKWLKEDFISSEAVFYNDIPKMAKAFGEHLSPLQITYLLLKALEGLTNEDKNISQAAGIMFNSFLEECGTDVEELPTILRKIYQRLPSISDPTTKENILMSMCHLASKRVNKVVDFLLECSVDCDKRAREIWRALVADPYANKKIMRPLLKRLQDEDPVSETTSKRNSQSIMPIAATNALGFIMSLPEAAEVISSKFPSLLIGLITQIYFLLGGSEQEAGRKPLSSAVQALQDLILCTGRLEEYQALGKKGCWKMLQSPDHLFKAISHLVGTLFTLSSTQLKLMYKETNAYMRHSDLKVKTIGMAFFSELVHHAREWRTSGGST